MRYYPRVLRFAACALLLAAPYDAHAQFAGGDQDGGVHSMTLLGMAVSPRAIALGEAMAGIDRDPAAIWYNTAGLAGMETNAFTVTASQRFAQTQLGGAAVAFPTQLATFGIAARFFNAGTVENRIAGEPTGASTRAFQFALEGGGAIQLANWWRWGGTLVYAQETLGEQTEGSVGINSSMQFPGLWNRVTLGGGVRNWGTNVNFDEAFAGFAPPFYGYVGGAVDLLRDRNLMRTPMLFRGQPIIFDAKAVAQLFIPEQHELFGGFGIEATVNGVAIARLGYQTGDDNRSGLSLGAGVNVGQFRLEYAFRNYKNGGADFFENDPVGDAHNVSFTYFWGESRENVPVVPVVVQAPPLDTAAINAAVRSAISDELGRLRPLLDSLRESRVEIIREGDISRYIVPVFFGFDSALIRPQDTTVLRQVADVIRQVYPTALVTISGFADPAGSPEYNIRLSQRRAEAVKAYMVQLGMPERQFKAVGYGEEAQRQVVPGARRDDPGAVQNRRVTFTIDATQRF